MSSLMIRFSFLIEHLVLMGRNSRWPNRANHGARPCSSVMRRMRREGFYQRARNEGTAGIEIATDDDDLDAEAAAEEEAAKAAEKAAEGAQTGQAGGQGGAKDGAKEGQGDTKGGKGEQKGESLKQEAGKAKGK